MNKRQFKKVHCKITYNGRSMSMVNRVPCWRRKAVRAWIRSVLMNEDVMLCMEMKDKYGIDILEMTEKERMWAIAKHVCLEQGWKEAQTSIINY